MAKEIKVTTLAQLKNYADGQVVELPGFGEGQPFVARLKRPSMLALAKSGKIPNTLMNSATKLFEGDVTSNDGSSDLSDIINVLEILCEPAFVSPTWAELQEAGIELTDEQIIAVFNYTQQGVKSLENFR